MSAREGIPFGCLYGLFALLAYVCVLPVGLMLFWGAFPSTGAEWVTAISRALVFFAAWACGLVPVGGIALYLTARDRSIMTTLRTNWPIICAALYVVLPDPLLGPFDDIVVAGLGSALQLWFWGRQMTAKRQLDGDGAQGRSSSNGRDLRRLGPPR